MGLLIHQYFIDKNEIFIQIASESKINILSIIMKMKFIELVVIIVPIFVLLNCSNKKAGKSKNQILFCVDSLVVDKN